MKNTHVSRSGGGHARYDAEYKREALKLWLLDRLFEQGHWS